MNGMSSLQLFIRLAALETDECVVWPRHTNNGYGRITISGHKTYLHSLALEMRTGKRPDGHDAAHGPCHNRACINYRHLRWATRAENVADMVRDGSICRGEDRPQSKITERDVFTIRRLAERGMPSKQIAAIVGISRQAVNDVKAGRRWGWLTDDGAAA